MKVALADLSAQCAALKSEIDAVTHRRDELRTFLREHDIETEVYYPKPLHQQTPFARGESFSEAERACREVFALPVHPHLDRTQLDDVADAIRRFY